jgi:uncharacterized protein YcgI (DUF1989 family)
LTPNFCLQFTSTRKHAEVLGDYGNTGKHHGKAKESGFEAKGFHSGAACESSLREKRAPHQGDQHARHAGGRLLGSLERVCPRKGDVMVTNRRRPILKIMEDTAPGTHDTLLAACDRYRYELLGCKEYHRNCTDNFWEAMVELGLKPTELPSPFNLWQNTPVEADGTIRPNPPVSKKGDYIVMRAEMDLVICLSACPQDITSICGNKPRNAHFEVL